MGKILGAFLATCLLTLASCSTEASQTTTDMCSHCAGSQLLTAQGTCEKCGMKMDCCLTCPGEQTLTADGKCPVCGTKVPVKA